MMRLNEILNIKCNLHNKLFESSSYTFFLKVLSEGVNFRSRGSEFQTFASRKANDIWPVESRQCGKLRSLSELNQISSSYGFERVSFVCELGLLQLELRLCF